MTSPDAGPVPAFFARLTADEAEAVRDASHEVSFPDGGVILQEGRRAHGCWVIRTGEVALTASVPGAAPVVLQTLGPGDMVGWSWLTDSKRWLFTATAHGPVHALELDTDRLRALADADAAFGYALTRTLLDAVLSRLQSTRARLLDVYRSPRER